VLLVTGGTGTLGRPLVSTLTATGQDVSVLSRSSGSGSVSGDLTTGAGLAEALAGVDTVVHCASDTRRFGKSDVLQTENLIAAARTAGVRHLIYISIVGIDRIPMSYYRRKLAVEHLIESSGLPWTTLRATQFHNLLVDLYFGSQRAYPFLFVPRGTVQPVAVEVVADRLAELASGSPRGRVGDLGGPEVLDFAGAAQAYLESVGRKPRTVHLPALGKLARAIAAGHLTCPDHRSGGQTFREFLAEK
jgi:uncharacterized protein YbjT (DUF2867 family)